MKKLTIGTRGSKLALKQTDIVRARLEALYPDMELSTRIITTTGDTTWDKPLHLVGGKGLFVKEIEDALLNEEIDIAVHSVKDIPTELPETLVLGAVLEREERRDAFISFRYRGLSDLPSGATIGTGSLRRKSQLLHVRKDLQIVPIRGNIDTRIRKLETQNLDAIILAFAGIIRMGLADRVTDIIPLSVMVPPSGQGAIGIECRLDPRILAVLEQLNHTPSFYEITIERELQAMIGGGCQVPLGITAVLSNKEVTLFVVLGDESGRLLYTEQRVFGTEDVHHALPVIAGAVGDVLAKENPREGEPGGLHDIPN